MPGGLLDRLTLGPWRRRRRMTRQLRALDAIGDLPYRPASPPRDRLGRRSPGLRALTAFAVLGGAFVIFQAIGPHFGYELTLRGLKHIERLAPAVHADSTGGTWAYTMTQPDDPTEPVRYDPCKPIRYEVNNTLAPTGGDAVVFEAITVLEEATGLRFEFEGFTTTSPASDPEAPAHRFGSGYPPVLIAWTTPEVVGRLEGNVAGLGGSSAISVSGGSDRVYVTGAISLDVTSIRGGDLDSAGDRARIRAVLLHELGHLVGLDHVEDRRELMHATNSGQTQFGPGDLQGLAILGQGKCYR